LLLLKASFGFILCSCGLKYLSNISFGSSGESHNFFRDYFSERKALCTEGQKLASLSASSTSRVLGKPAEQYAKRVRQTPRRTYAKPLSLSKNHYHL